MFYQYIEFENTVCQISAICLGLCELMNDIWRHPYFHENEIHEVV